MGNKIFGIGLNKTGTTTLAACFTRLGMKHMSCRGDLLAAYRRGNLSTVFAEIDQYESFEDWPFPLMYKEIFRRYGLNSRFILTKRRNSQVWLESLKSHSLRTTPSRHCRLLAYSYSYPHGAEDYHKDFYERHLSEVRAFFRDNDAEQNLLELCWEEGDGWSKLCDFLDIPRRLEPFPCENVGKDRPVDMSVVKQNIELIRAQIGLLRLDLDDRTVLSLALSTIPEAYHNLLTSAVGSEADPTLQMP